MVLVIVLANFVGPGFAHGLMGQTRAMWIVIGLFAASLVAIAFTIWALPLVFAVIAGAIVDSVRRYLRIRDTVRFTAPPALISVAAVIAIALLGRMLVVEAFKIPSSAMIPTLEIGDHLFISKLRTDPAPGDIIVFRQPCQTDRDYIKRVIALAKQTVEIRCNIVYVDGKPISQTLVDTNASYQDYYEDFNGPAKWVGKNASRYREQLGKHSYDIMSDPAQPQRDATRKNGGLLSEGDTKDFPQTILYSCENSTDPDSQRATNQKSGTIVELAPEGEDPCKPHRHYVVPEDHVFVLGDNRPNSNDSRYWGPVPVENIKGTAIGIWLPFRRFGGID
jgi:signal peptidase I